MYAPKFQVGKTYRAQIINGPDTTATGAQDEYRLTRYIIHGSCIVDRIRFSNSSANAGALYRVCGYSSNDFGFPSALIFDSGDISTAVAGIKTISGLSIPLVRGIYWFGGAAHFTGTTVMNYSQFGPSEYGFPRLDDTLALAGAATSPQVSNKPGAPPNPWPAEGPIGGTDSNWTTFGPLIELRFSAAS